MHKKLINKALIMGCDR